MTQERSPYQGPARRALLLALAAVAAAAWLATPWLIVPYTAATPWYESTAMFPRVALSMLVVGALVEALRCARPAAEADQEGDEMDASGSRPTTVLIVLALFAGYVLVVPVLGFLLATLAFLLACGFAVGLGARRTVLLGVPLALVLWLVFVQGLKVSFGGWF